MYLKAGERTQICIPLMMRCPATSFRDWLYVFQTDCKITAGTGLAAGAGIADEDLDGCRIRAGADEHVVPVHGRIHISRTGVSGDPAPCARVRSFPVLHVQPLYFPMRTAVSRGPRVNCVGTMSCVSCPAGWQIPLEAQARCHWRPSGSCGRVKVCSSQWALTRI